MGLKDDLMEAKLKGLELSGAKKEDLETAKKKGSPLEIQSEMEKEAIIKFLTTADFKITELNAPIILENLKTPDQAVNVKLETLLGEYGPILKTLKQIANFAQMGQLIAELEEQIENAVKPVLEGGSTLPGLDITSQVTPVDSIPITEGTTEVSNPITSISSPLI